jgi:hypothetical protein
MAMHPCLYACGRTVEHQLDVCPSCGTEAVNRIWEHERRIKERREVERANDRRQPLSRTVEPSLPRL